MKRSKLLVMVLALVLCISMVLVGCSKKDDVIEEVTLSEEEQKNEVVKTFNQNESISLSELNARESLEKILGTNVFELTLNKGGYKSIVAYKDGYVYTDIKEDEWLYIGASDVATFEKNPLTNKWVGKIVGGNNDSMGIIGGGSVLSKVQVPEEIKLPELKASDLTVEDGGTYPLAAPQHTAHYLTHPRQARRDFAEARWKIGFLQRAVPLPLPYGKLYLKLKK